MTQFPPTPPSGTGPWSPGAHRPQTGSGGGAADFQSSLEGARYREARPLEPQTLALLARMIRHRLASTTLSGGGGALGRLPAMMHGMLQQSGQGAPASGQMAVAPERKGAPRQTTAGEARPQGAGDTAGGGEVAESDANRGDDSDRPYADLIREAATKHDVPESLVRAVVRAESDFDPEAVSPAGAQGLMQLMPDTAEALGVSEPFDPRENVMAGTRYLRRLLDRYDGDRELALAAYNWGMGNLEDSPDALPEETVTYVEKVRQWADSARA